MSDTPTAATLRCVLTLSDNMHESIRLLSGAGEALRHFEESPSRVGPHALALVAASIERAESELNDILDEMEAARTADRDTIADLTGQIKALKKQMEATPAGRIKSLSSIRRMLRAGAEATLEILDRDEAEHAAAVQAAEGSDAPEPPATEDAA